METAPRRLSAYEVMAAARRYADLLRGVDYVEKVLLEEVEWEGLRLWTVLSSPPFEDRYTEAVYAAQAKILDELVEPVFDFRVINVNELAGKLEAVLPSAADTLFDRHI